MFLWMESVICLRGESKLIDAYTILDKLLVYTHTVNLIQVKNRESSFFFCISVHNKLQS